MAYILIFLLYQKECLIHHCKYYQYQYENDGSNLSVIFIWHNLHDILILSIDLKSIFLNPKGRYVYETPFNLLEVKEIHYYLACRKILLFKTQCSFLVSDEHTFVIQSARYLHFYKLRGGNGNIALIKMLHFDQTTTNSDLLLHLCLQSLLQP